MPSVPELEKWLKQVYKEKADVDIQSVRAYATKLWEGASSGYGKGFADVDYDSKDYDIMQKLRSDVYTFSYAKNHAELRALTAAIIDDEGVVRSYESFRKEAAKIVGEFRGHWLQAEYELAVAAGQMNAKWQEFETSGEDTMLRYSTVKDARVSDICRPLEAVTKPLSDPFWNTYYPPNHFRCRCDVDRIPYTAKATPDSSINLPDIPPMLRTNLAKQTLIFPTDHPYYIGLDKKKAADVISKEIDDLPNNDN